MKATELTRMNKTVLSTLTNTARNSGPQEFIFCYKMKLHLLHINFSAFQTQV